MSVTAQNAEEVLEVARRVNSYFTQKWPDPTKDTFVRRKRPSNLWTRGVYYEGLMALYGIDAQSDYIKYVDDWAIYHKWSPRNGTKTTNADDQCCMQTYLDRYEVIGDQKMLDSCLVNMQKQMAQGRVDYWTWIDAIQMAMPAYAKMYRITGDVRYILFARDCYEWSRNTCGGGLWNPQEGLWWRDADFVPPYKENDGQNCYWSRGNGWVVAALVRTIDCLALDSSLKGNQFSMFNAQCSMNKEVCAFCDELKSDYKAMMKALLKCQREDGFWNVSLMSPSTFGGPETSGTALFLMGMAWGVRNELLPAEEYRSAIDKAWNAIATAIHPNGFIGYLQGTGKEPKDGQPVTYTSVPDFEDYGTGCVLLGAVEYYKLIKNEGLDSSRPDSKAGARWWWLGSAVTKPGLTWQMEQMASHGIGTLEITPLYGVQGNDANNISFLSPEWMKMLEFTINEGKRLGIQIDMNLGTGWPFGSPETPLSEAACKLVVVDSLVDSKLAKSITLPAPQKERQYARLIIQKDFKSHIKGKRRVIALYESRTRQMVKRAAPGGEGYVIDHFDSTAVAHYLSRFDRAFKSSGAPMPATFFNDSYEVFGADWTPTLPKEFEKRRGYRLEDKLQEFVDGDAQVISDYRETLSDLLLKNFTEQWVRWSHERGVKVRNQAHGSPANLIDIYAAVDIPEIEGFGLSDFGIKGLRTDPGMTRKNFSDLSMLKYASSAAHITGKRLVSSETFTWLTEHFRTSLSQMKPDLDLMFCSGVNRMFFHGACYSPKDDPWPGWKFYASVDMSPTNTIWRDASMLMRYIDFCQQRLQEGDPDNDFLVLLPVRNMWRTNLDKRLMLFEINSMDKKAPDFIASILKIDSLGYDCDYISEKYLLSTSYVNGKLQTVAGTRYAALILPSDCILTRAVKRHIESLKRQGAPIIYNMEGGELAKYAKAEELRTALHMKMIRRRVGNGYRYFVSNLTPNDVRKDITLAATGERVNVSLRSGESCFIDASTDGNATVTYPVSELQPDNSQFSTLNSQFSTLADLTNNEWSLRFIESQPAVNQIFTLDGLRTWEELPVDSLSELMGTGVYETTFHILPGNDRSGSYMIDLGDVRESARVYINDTYVGCAWCVPFTLKLDGVLRDGENSIRIEVTNLPANRIAAYDRRGVKWRKFNEINVVDINYKRTSYADWKPVPSGLNSHVKIYKYTE
jgi:rhamnogalacturonyl hydrolase YesR